MDLKRTMDLNMCFDVVEHIVVDYLLQGTLSVIDSNGTMPTRVWCDFEFAISLRENGVEYKCDIITAQKHRLNGGARAAVAITDGLVAADEGHVSAKTARESFFPDSLLQAAMSIQLQNGLASVESDRIHILNWLIGRTGSDLELPVHTTHSAYDDLNAMLHGRVAAGAVRRAVEGGAEMLATYLRAINLSNLRKLAVDFLGCDACTAAIAEQIIDSLPSTLVDLKLTHCYALNGPLPPSIANLVSLEKLAIEGTQVTDVSVLSSLESLRELDLRYTRVMDTGQLSENLTIMLDDAQAIGCV